MRALTIHAHFDPASFCRAVVEKLRNGLRQAGHESGAWPIRRAESQRNRPPHDAVRNSRLPSGRSRSRRASRGARDETSPWTKPPLAHHSFRLWVVRSAIVIPLLAASACVTAMEAQAEIWTGQSVVVAGQHDQEQFAAGETVRITAQVTDGVFATGREVRIEGASAKSLHVVAGKTEFRRSSVGELIVAGFDVEIDGTVEDDALIGVCPACPWASGRVLIGEDARIGDELHVVGRTVEIRGTVNGNLRAVGHTIVLAGTVGGSVDLKADRIVIAPGAKVTGELTARSPTPPEVPADATPARAVNYVPTPQSFPDLDAVSDAFAWIAVAAIGATVLALVVLSLLTQIAVPGWVRSSVDQLYAHPAQSVGLGLLCAVLLPILGLVLMVSVIGIPAAVVLLGASLTLAAGALATASYAIGLFIRGHIGSAREEPNFMGRVGWTALGIIPLALIAAIPLLGALVVAVALLASLGAVAKCAAARTRPMPFRPA